VATLAPTEDDLRKFLRDIVFARLIGNCAAYENGSPESGVRPPAKRDSESKLNTFIELLNAPERSFRLEASGFCVLNEEKQPVELPLLHCADRRQWIVGIVRFSAQEALEAQSRESNKHRYIYL
jgi:hypothetical protein